MYIFIFIQISYLMDLLRQFYLESFLLSQFLFKTSRKEEVGGETEKGREVERLFLYLVFKIFALCIFSEHCSGSSLNTVFFPGF